MAGQHGEGGGVVDVGSLAAEGTLEGTLGEHGMERGHLVYADTRVLGARGPGAAQPRLVVG